MPGNWRIYCYDLSNEQEHLYKQKIREKQVNEKKTIQAVGV